MNIFVKGKQERSISDGDSASMLVNRPRKSTTGFTLGFFALFALFVFVNFRSVIVDGLSMYPTFKNGQRVTVSSAYWLVGPIQDNDCVVIRDDSKDNATGYIIKRVYKMGGEIVDYANSPKQWNLADGEFKVPEGQIFVLGDNRLHSEDSRSFGPVPLNKVLGKVIRRA